MPDAGELLAVARLLLSPESAEPPSDAQLRRSVSTAYYAVFHKLAGLAAQRFMGPGQENTAGYAILYRGFDHRRVRDVCDSLQAATLKERYRDRLSRSAVSQAMREFVSSFPTLQDYRHRADYDPAMQLLRSEVETVIITAQDAMNALDRVAPDEQTDVLALMLVGARG